MQINDKQIAATIRHAGTNRDNERRPTGRAREKIAKVILKTVNSAARVIAPSFVLSINAEYHQLSISALVQMRPPKHPPLPSAGQSFSAH
jgi:hypothetical protein